MIGNEFAGDVAAVSRIDAVPAILDVVCRATGLRFAAIARVTDDRWVACAVLDQLEFGLQPGEELEIEATFCRQVRNTRDPVVFDDVKTDDVYRGHPVAVRFGIQSYISVPILRPDGSFFGTLCALDTKPAKVRTQQTTEMFRLFAQLIGFHLDALDRLGVSETGLRQEREDAKLREQFIAVLGHDLRNPLAAIDAGARVLVRGGLDEAALRIVEVIQSTVRRMAGLINNVLDFARARLGGGWALQLDCDARLLGTLEQVVAEYRASAPDRVIDLAFDIRQTVPCDAARIGQLFSNLIGNALAHGAPGAPVRVTASVKDDRFELSVVNAGARIPPEIIDRLFQPFFRGAARDQQQGLGLGLFISAEIARAHGGTLTVASSDQETRFTLNIPLAQA